MDAHAFFSHGVLVHLQCIATFVINQEGPVIHRTGCMPANRHFKQCLPSRLDRLWEPDGEIR